MKVFTEEPELELWRSLLQFSYKANISRYFDDNNIEKKAADDILENSIAGAILQAYEYYMMSKSVSLQVEPLLLYYGTTNLLYGLYVLMNGEIPNIKYHGIQIIDGQNTEYIAETKLKFNHKEDGGFRAFAGNLGFDTYLGDYNPWQLWDFLDSIVEIQDDFKRCYRNNKSHILLLNTVNTPEGIVEKIYLEFDEAESTLNMVEDFLDAYLNPQWGFGRNNEYYLVLRRKMNGKPIQQVAYSGQSYLQVGHKKNGKNLTIPKELNMYVSLFVLGNLCRYYPAKWNQFVTQDSTGEKLLIEKLLYYSRRILPNIILNNITKKQVVFVSEKYTPENHVRLVGEHEVRDIVEKELRIQREREQVEKFMKPNWS